MTSTLSIEEIARLRDVWRRSANDPHTRKSAEERIEHLTETLTPPRHSENHNERSS
jgi:hypothetical protein